MTIDQMIEVLQAAKAGKAIQRRLIKVPIYPDQPCQQDPWENACGVWDFSCYDYRVKPEPKVIYVNEYEGGWLDSHHMREFAQIRANGRGLVRTAVKYVEVIE